MEVVSLISSDDESNEENIINNDEYWMELEYAQKSKTDSLPSHISNPMRINKNEYAFATKCRGICKYNASKNIWDLKWIPYPKEVRKIYNPNVCCFDHIHNIIYIYDTYGKLLKVDLSTKQIEISDSKIRLRFPRLVFTYFNKNPQLHLISGAENNYHYIYNINGKNDNLSLELLRTDTDEWDDDDYDNDDEDEDDDLDNKNGLFIKHHKFDYEAGIAGFGVFYVDQYCQKEQTQTMSSSAPNANKFSSILLITGGIQWDTRDFEDRFWRYDHITQIVHNDNTNTKMISKHKQRWNAIPSLKIPNGGMSRFGYTMTKNKQYIILCGGFCDFEERDEIYFVDTITWKVRESKIKCPKESKDFHAITMINEGRDELIIFGYVRWLYYRSKHKQEFDSILFPPVYIIKFISNWYYNEYVYLIEYMTDPITQWKIHTDLIINNFVDDIDDSDKSMTKKDEDTKNEDDEEKSAQDIDNNDIETTTTNQYAITPL